MELVTLDSQFQPSRIVDNYKSLLWAERYLEHSDFELVSNDISRCISMLPLESTVSIRESTVPMVVEDYKIRKPLRGAPEVVITGRSFETVLERRASVISLPPDYATEARIPWMMSADKESDAAYKVIRTVIGDGPRNIPGGPQVLTTIAPAVSPLDAIPEINPILPIDYSAGLTREFDIPAQNLYKTVLDLLATNRHGIKSIRPEVGGTKIRIEIYNGADLTQTVAFDARFDQLDDATYLLSNRGSANVGYIYGSNGASVVRKNNGGTEVSGLNRRVLLIDEAGDQTLTNTDVRTSRALVELYKYNATALFDGETSEQVAAEFGQKYFLGDLLKLVGEYGLSQNVRVAEFIRSSDASGNKAYPTFEAVD